MSFNEFYDSISSIKYQCAFCGKTVASTKGSVDSYCSDRKIMICPNCEEPTYFDKNLKQYPTPVFGKPLEHLPKEINQLFNEARYTMSVNAYTCVVIACRTLLMHIAVDQGAEEGLSFKEYVEYLAQEGFIPKKGKGWVDHIRQQGNTAVHKIRLQNSIDAEQALTFTEHLLLAVYDFPARVNLPNK
jgi:endogenous inhibitor of DNA gyrase (YacG/DUF329 family)